MRLNIKQYQGTARATQLLEADPHQIILALMDGAIEKMAIAKGCMERNDISGKSTAISRAVAIIGGLQGALDFQANAQVARNFNDFYEFVIGSLVEASATRNAEQLETLITLFTPLRDAWRDMPPAAKAEGIDALQRKSQTLP